MMDDMKPYAVHDDVNIRGFFGEYKWLSNFYICPVVYEGIEYQSATNAYQAAKVKPECRYDFIDVQPHISKTMWKKYSLVDDSKEEWDVRKFDVMVQIVFDKFMRNKDLRVKLRKTGGKYLENTSDWGSQYWGYDVTLKRGKNQLGVILMTMRYFWGILEIGKNSPVTFQEVCSSGQFHGLPMKIKKNFSIIPPATLTNISINLSSGSSATSILSNVAKNTPSITP